MQLSSTDSITPAKVAKISNANPTPVFLPSTAVPMPNPGPTPYPVSVPDFRPEPNTGKSLISRMFPGLGRDAREVSDRLKFIRKVFVILFLQVSITAG